MSGLERGDGAKGYGTRYLRGLCLPPSRLIWLFGLLSLTLVPAHAEVVEKIALPSKTELSLFHYPAPGRAQIIWMPSESGTLDQERALARRLSVLGFAVWMPDFHGSYFLPSTLAGLAQIPPEDLNALLEEISARDRRPMLVLSSGQGGRLALQVAQRWVAKYRNDDSKRSQLAGLILVSAPFYMETPTPGFEGELWPELADLNLAVLLIQPNLSPWYWKLSVAAAAMEKSGSQVITWVLPGIRDRFYYRPDATTTEDQWAARFHALLVRGIEVLSPYTEKERLPVFVPATVVVEVKPADETERQLSLYRGAATPPQLTLDGLEGGSYRLDQFIGKVVVLNFWASWCPPCIHEMPSLKQLKQRLGARGLEVVAVNMAEDPTTVRRFVTDIIKADFVYLMDRDGAALKRWKVYAFPTSYVLDRQGCIRYAVFGAIDWSAPATVATFEKLLNTQTADTSQSRGCK